MNNKSESPINNISRDLLAAFREARQYLFANIHKKIWTKVRERSGDETYAFDEEVFEQFYRKAADNYKMLLVCEETCQEPSRLDSRGLKYALIIDPIDGSKNMVSNLTFGVNIAFGELKKQQDFRIGDIQGVIIADYLTQKVFLWNEGAKTEVFEAVYDQPNKWSKSPIRSNLFEVPDEKSYVDPSYKDGPREQLKLLRKFRAAFPKSQRRAIDCTGLIMLEVTQNNLIAYGDVRHATSIWDTIPSIKYILEDNHGFLALSGNFQEYNDSNVVLRHLGNEMYTVDENVGKDIIVFHRSYLDTVRNADST
jgi:fructose-1,6-bisphosphatase/inositol monophosphatase family enzyme